MDILAKIKQEAFTREVFGLKVFLLKILSEESYIKYFF